MLFTWVLFVIFALLTFAEDVDLPKQMNVTRGRQVLTVPHPSTYPEIFWVRLGQSPVHGRGVFAVRDLRAHTIVEVCPTIMLEKVDCIYQNCPLMNYVFASQDEQKIVVALGYGMLYNSAKDSNVLHYFDSDDNLVFVAKRDIRKGEEIFHYYGTEWWTSRKGKVAEMHLPEGPEERVSTK